MLNKKLISFSLPLLLGTSSLTSVNAYAADDSNSQNFNQVVTESNTINSYPTEGNY